MATAKKAAAKPVAAKQEVVEEATVEVGSQIRFTGYADDVPEDEQYLEVGSVHEVVGLTEAEGEDPGDDPIVEIENPNFDAKKKEHPEKNAKTMHVAVLLSEMELVEGEEEAAEEVAPAPAAKKVAPKAAAKPAAKAAAAPAKAEKAKVTPAKKGSKVAKAEAPAEEEAAEEEKVDILDVDLESEDAEVLALIEGTENIIELAQELDGNIATDEWRLGGILYHIRKDKKYLEVEGGEAYAEKGGFEVFLTEMFNVGYRKAMHLIKIYAAFNIAKIENAAEKVAQIGWTKASKIAPVILKAEDPAAEATELVELAENNTVEDLSTAITEQVTVGGTKGTGGEKKARTTLKFRYFEQEAATVNSILETAKETLGVQDIGEALLHVLQEWANANAGGSATAKSAPKQKVAAPAAKKVVAAKKTATA
jgi:hypothetical protein